MNLIALLHPTRLILPVLLVLPLTLDAAQGTAAPEAPARPRDPSLISIDFPGGPFSKLVATLTAENLSIIQSQGLDPVLPAFSVKDATIDSVIMALGRIIEPQGYILNPTGRNVAVLMRLPQNPGQGFASLQLESKLGDRKAEDVVAAIQQGCEFFNEGRPSTLRFKYHPATKLLFVAGTADEINVAERIFASLPSNPPKVLTPPPDKR